MKMNSIISLHQFTRTAPLSQVLCPSQTLNSRSVLPNFAVRYMPKMTIAERLFPSLLVQNAIRTCAWKPMPMDDIRNHYIRRRMMMKIELFGLDLLPDERTLDLLEKQRCVNKHRLKEPWYWRLIFKLSKSYVNTELKEKLRNAGISQRDFGLSVARLYAVLEWKLVLVMNYVPFETDDVVQILKEKKLSDVEYESIRILFGMRNFDELRF